MKKLSRTKLKAALQRQGLNLAKLAKTIGSSRQSLYAMLKGASIYNRPFEKIVHKLGVDPDALCEETGSKPSFRPIPEDLLRDYARLKPAERLAQAEAASALFLKLHKPFAKTEVKAFNNWEEYLNDQKVHAADPAGTL